MSTTKEEILSEKDIVAEARELAPYVQGVADATGGGKLSRIPSMLRDLASEVERLRGICDVAIKGVGAPIMHPFAQDALQQLRTVRKETSPCQTNNK